MTVALEQPGGGDTHLIHSGRCPVRGACPAVADLADVLPQTYVVQTLAPLEARRLL